MRSMASPNLSLSQPLRYGVPCSKKQFRVFCGYSKRFSNFNRTVSVTTKLQEDIKSNRSVLANFSKPKNSEQPAQKHLPPVSWVDTLLPEPARPYAKLARLDEPLSFWLGAWPCFWGITIAIKNGGLPDMKVMALFGYSSFMLKGISCTVNDLLDLDIDSKVERTKTRPLASGAITPAQGFYFLVAQVVLWLGFLVQLNNSCLIPGACWLLLFFTYPLMKRITYWPQAYLGLPMNLGALVGWIAVEQKLDPSIILPMYAGGICWTVLYDTIYAHQDKKDDLKIGVKSTAVKFGHNTKYWLSAFAAGCIGSFAFSGYNAHLGWPYYTFLAAAAGHLGWQILTVDLSNGSDCFRKFVSNMWFGAFIFAGILCGQHA